MKLHCFSTEWRNKEIFALLLEAGLWSCFASLLQQSIASPLDKYDLAR